MALTIKINYDKCNGCKKCISACMFRVFELLDDTPVVSHPRNCLFNCGDCEKNCPMNAIIIEGANSPVNTSYVEKYNDMKKQLAGTKNEN